MFKITVKMNTRQKSLKNAKFGRFLEYLLENSSQLKLVPESPCYLSDTSLVETKLTLKCFSEGKEGYWNFSTVLLSLLSYILLSVKYD